MAELLDRARQLIDAGAHNAQAAEVAAVHDAIWPAQAPVCPTLTCRAVLGRAFFTIKRWLDQQDNSPSTSTSSTVSKTTSIARFHSDTTTLFPHGLGMGFSNDNLTDSAARYILENDPEAEQFFKVLPPEAEGEEEFQPKATEAAATEAPTASTVAPTQSLPADFDYDKLADKVFERLKSHAENQGGAPDSTQQPALTASTGGAADTADGDTHEDGKPLPLSRLNKEQLVAAYRTELQADPPADMLNDDLRSALASHRAGQQDPE
ncbi:MAG: hypothetical protein ACRYFZ_11945 [Janthinobacterium lividum]